MHLPSIPLTVHRGSAADLQATLTLQRHLGCVKPGLTTTGFRGIPRSGSGRCPVVSTELERQTASGDGTRLSVLNPQGYPPRVTPKDMAPRLDTLEGKTVYLVD